MSSFLTAARENILHVHVISLFESIMLMRKTRPTIKSTRPIANRCCDERSERKTRKKERVRTRNQAGRICRRAKLPKKKTTLRQSGKVCKCYYPSYAHRNYRYVSLGSCPVVKKNPAPPRRGEAEKWKRIFHCPNVAFSFHSRAVVTLRTGYKRKT